MRIRGKCSSPDTTGRTSSFGLRPAVRLAASGGRKSTEMTLPLSQVFQMVALMTSVLTLGIDF
jgi:hypothetical protein